MAEDGYSLKGLCVLKTKVANLRNWHPGWARRVWTSSISLERLRRGREISAQALPAGFPRARGKARLGPRLLLSPSLPAQEEMRPAGHLSTSHTEPCTASFRKPALPGLWTPRHPPALRSTRAGAIPQPCQVGTIALIFSLLGGHATWHVEPPHLAAWPHPLQGVRKSSPPCTGREEDPVHVNKQHQPALCT